MSKPPAFQFYADDFLAGCVDMSNEEVGAYIRLLCHQWSKGGIPNDPDRISRMAGAMPVPSLGYVLAKFRLCEDEQYRNDRLEAERQKQADFRQEQSIKGKIGAQKRWKNSTGHSPAMAAAMPVPIPEAWPDDSSPSPSTNSNNTPLAPKGASDSREVLQQASEIYAAYPLKVGKPAALKAIIKQLASMPFETLLELTQRYAASRKGDLSFTPHPSTWFNQQRFNDDPITWTNANSSKPTRPGINRNEGNSNASVADEYRLD